LPDPDAPRSTDDLIARAAPGLFVVLWASGFVGAKFGLPYAEPMTFLCIRMAAAAGLLAVLALATRPPWPTAGGFGHNIVAGLLVHGFYLGGVFIAISHGLPAGLAALVTGLQPILTSTLANRFLGERVRPWQWVGLGLGLVGVWLVVHEKTGTGSVSLTAWIAITVALLGITLGTLYQKRFGGGTDWRSALMVQYAAAGIVFAAAAWLTETRMVQWTADFIFAVGWLVLVLSLGAVWLFYFLIRRSAATQVASLFYLVPPVTAVMAFGLFGERLAPLALVGMALCAGGVFLVNQRAASR